MSETLISIECRRIERTSIECRTMTDVVPLNILKQIKINAISEVMDILTWVWGTSLSLKYKKKIAG